MAGDIPNPDALSEEQLRAAYEQEIKRVRVDQVLLENVVTMVNLGMRRTGLVPGTEDERDLAQVQLAIESVRALMPQIEQVAPQQLAQIRDAVSRLQMAFVQASGGGAQASGGGTQGGEPTGGGGEPVGGGGEPQQQPKPEPGAPGPAQKSGRLWVPGQ